MGKLPNLLKSGYISCFLAACVVTSTLAADVSICPPADQLLPCRCNEEGISCIGPMNVDTVRKSLQATNTHRVIRNLWVQGTSLTEFPENLGQYLKSENFFVEFNPSLKTVGNLRAFWPSDKIIHTLSLYGNKIESIPFGDLRWYPRVRVVNFGRNEIKHIENNAFNQPNLTTLILRENKIPSIGQNAFRDLPSLQLLDLEGNLITTLGQESLQTKLPNPRLQINLGDNIITTIDEKAFGITIPHLLFLRKNRFTSLPSKPLLTVVSRMAQIGGHLEVSDNPFDCKGCDYTWIVDNQHTAARMLVGFKCTNGMGVKNLTRSNIGC